VAEQGRTAKLRTAKNFGAWQRWAHGKEFRPTAKLRRTAALAAHGKDASHGSVRSARQRWRRTAKGFAVHSLHAHGKGGFAVGGFAVSARTATATSSFPVGAPLLVLGASMALPR
jgi:hypothetical protein